jgi:mono/diheme cytochrome c family protein
MRRLASRFAFALAALLLVVGGGLGAGVAVRWDRIVEMTEPRLQASGDPEMIERGRYLVYGPSHCAYCHTAEDNLPALIAGEEPPLAGGGVLRVPLAELTTPNLTPDPETGIGRYTDGQLARMIRHNVRADGRLAVPIMEFEDMSDEDVVAVLSFLRSRPPVRNEVGARKFTAYGKFVAAYMMKPTAPKSPARRTSPPEAPTVDRGEYVATALAMCAACHTKRNPRDGSYTVPRFAGGFEMEVIGDPKRMYVTPNLTPDPKTGQIATWTEDEFVRRFRAGTLNEGTHMPWEAYRRMSDDDLRAVYRFLMSLEPVEHDTGPIVRLKR